MVFLLYLVFSAGAATLEQAFIERLHHARPAAVESVREEFERIQVARLACKIQIRSQLLPLSCYESLHLELNWRLRGADQTAALRRRLDDRCEKAARNLPGVPPPGKNLLGLTARCRRHLAEIRRIQAYRAERSWSGD